MRKEVRKEGDEETEMEFTLANLRQSFGAPRCQIIQKIAA
jgi:hypothetical protein